MKVIGETSILEKKINGKTIHYLKVREYDRNGKFNEAEIFCRLTRKAQEQLNVCNCLEQEMPIEIKDSFYTVDKYYKGEQQYTKATLVIADIEI